MSEAAEVRLKRLAMRSARRGTKEMDLILMRFAETLRTLSAAELDGYEALLEENDQDLFLWVTGRVAAPAEHGAILARVRAVALER